MTSTLLFDFVSSSCHVNLISKIVGNVALREIRRCQKTTHLSIKLTPFKRLIKEISHGKEVGRSGPPVRWQALALGAIYEAAKAFLSRGFESKLLL